MNKADWQQALEAEPPKLFPASGYDYDGIKGLFYQGPNWQGRHTRVFAWYGKPPQADANHPVPGVVLVHGGGGTAFANWVKLWNDRGFAALALDCCGCVPTWKANPFFAEWPRHEWSGPGGTGDYRQADLPMREQWMYHAVMAVMNARKLMESMPEVAPRSIGLMGISWGAVIAEITAGIDDSFRFLIPVYGCGGFNTPESNLIGGQETTAQRNRWFQQWDPMNYVPSANMPMLWMTGTNDLCFPLGAWLETVRMANRDCRRVLQVEWIHNHSNSWNSPSGYDFAQSVLDGQPLPTFEDLALQQNVLNVKLNLPQRKLVRSWLCFTRATGAWQDRRWHEMDITPRKDNQLSALIPTLTACAFFNVQDDRGCIWSSELTACN